MWGIKGISITWTSLHNWGGIRNTCNCNWVVHKKVQVGKDQEKAQSEKDSHSKNRGGKKPN